MKIIPIYDKLHAEEHLTRAIQIITDEDVSSWAHFLAFETVNGQVKLTEEIHPDDVNGLVYTYYLTADLVPKSGNFLVQLIASAGGENTPQKRSDVYRFYSAPSIHVPTDGTTREGRYITVFTLEQRLDALENNIGSIIEEYLAEHPISIPYIEVYGYSELTPEQQGHNTEAFVRINTLSAQSKSFQAVMYTDENDLAYSGYFGTYPAFEFFDMTRLTHYRYSLYDNGTVTVEAIANIDPKAKLMKNSPTVNTEGDFEGQLAIAHNGTEIWTYRGKIGNVNFWERFAKYSDIPTVPTNVSAFTNDAGYLTAHQSLSGYATEEYVTSAISTALGSIETTLETLTTGGGI